MLADLNLVFKRHLTCPLCALGTDARHTCFCLPTRRWIRSKRQASLRDPQGKPSLLETKALLVIGKAPGSREVREDASFVGPAGQILGDWMAAMEVDKEVDIYLANTVRCRLADDGASIRRAQIDACSGYLKADVAELIRVYGPSRIVVLLLGADAVQAFRLGSLKDALRRQGQTAEIGGQGGLPVFATYHPAACLPGRDPAKMVAVQDHLRLLSDHLLDKDRQLASVETRLAPKPPESIPDVLALDIETYGILALLPEQTVFHPEKSKQVDGVVSKELTQTVALAWIQGGVMGAGVYRWGRHDEATQLYRWLYRLRKAKGVLICMNTLFDVLYMRQDALFRGVLRPPLVLEDLAIWNCLSSDRRPERSLEALSRLLGLSAGPTTGHATSKKFKRYPNVDTPELWDYNVSDSVNTLRARAKLMAQVQPLAKSEYTRQYFSRLLWSCVHMSEAGVRFSRPKLEALKTRLQEVMVRESAEFLYRTGGPLWGKGSAKAVRDFVIDALLEAGILGDPRVEKTQVRGEISTSDANLELLLGNLLIQGSKHRRLVLRVQAYRRAAKTYGTYIKPLLEPESKERLLKNNMAYPQWYVAPMEYAAGSRIGKTRGTVQGRITCTARQTDPPEVKACYISRYSPGCLMEIDLSQIEYRVAALLSGEPRMLEAFRAGRDLHDETTYLLAPEWDGAQKEPRQVAKSANFLLLFRGGARALQEWLRQNGIEKNLQWCAEVVHMMRRRNATFTAWQDRLIGYVNIHGYLDDPILGQRRFFTKSPRVNQTDYESMIVNCPIQRAAANLMCDVQSSLTALLECHKLAADVILNKYDSVVIDCKLGLQNKIRELYERCLTLSSFRCKLEAYTKRQVPLPYSVELKVFR